MSTKFGKIKMAHMYYEGSYGRYDMAIFRTYIRNILLCMNPEYLVEMLSIMEELKAIPLKKINIDSTKSLLEPAYADFGIYLARDYKGINTANMFYDAMIYIEKNRTYLFPNGEESKIDKEMFGVSSPNSKSASVYLTVKAARAVLSQFDMENLAEEDILQFIINDNHGFFREDGLIHIDREGETVMKLVLNGDHYEIYKKPETIRKIALHV